MTVGTHPVIWRGQSLYRDRRPGQTVLRRGGPGTEYLLSCLRLILGDRARKNVLYCVRPLACRPQGSEWLPCYRSLFCSSRYNVRWSGPEGATKGGSIFGGVQNDAIFGASFMGIVEKGLQPEPGIHSGARRFWKREFQELPRESGSGPGASSHCFEVEIPFKFSSLD